MKKNIVLLMYLFIKKNYLFIFFIFFISCYEQHLKINTDNNSGVIDLKITLNNDFKNFLLFLNEESKKIYDKFLVLEDKKELMTSLSKSKEITLLSYSKKINENSIEYFISISFNNLNEISDMLLNAYFPTKIILKDDIVTVITSLDLSNYINFIEINLNEQSNIYTYSQFIPLKFVYKVPGRINNIKSKNLNMDYLSKDLKEISFSTTLYNIIKNKGQNEINFTYTYRKTP